MEKSGNFKFFFNWNGYGSLLKSIDLQNFIIWSADFIGLKNRFQYKPGLGRIKVLVDEDGCKGSWEAIRNIVVEHVFIYTCMLHLYTTALIRSLENGQKSGYFII